jgi:hypothetical protein
MYVLSHTTGRARSRWYSGRLDPFSATGRASPPELYNASTVSSSSGLHSLGTLGSTNATGSTSPSKPQPTGNDCSPETFTTRGHELIDESSDRDYSGSCSCSNSHNECSNSDLSNSDVDDICLQSYDANDRSIELFPVRTTRQGTSFAVPLSSPSEAPLVSLAVAVESKKRARPLSLQIIEWQPPSKVTGTNSGQKYNRKAKEKDADMDRCLELPRDARVTDAYIKLYSIRVLFDRATYGGNAYDNPAFRELAFRPAFKYFQQIFPRLKPWTSGSDIWSTNSQLADGGSWRGGKR